MDTETKIVKGKIVKDKDKDEGASKVQIKAVDIASLNAQKEKAQKAKNAAKAKTDSQPARSAAPPAGRPMPKGTAMPKSSVPMGTAMPKSSVPMGTAMPKASVPSGKPMPKNAVPQKKADVPQPSDEHVNEDAVAQTADAVKAAEKPEINAESAALEKTADVDVSANEAAKAETEKTIDSPVSEVKEKAAAPAKKDKAEKQESTGKTEASDKAEKTAKSSKKEKKGAETAEKNLSPEGPAEKAPETDVKADEPKTQPVIDYTPGIGVKIIRRAADEPKPAPAAEKKPAKKDGKNPKNDRQGRPHQDRNDKNSRPEGSNKDRKPKEFVGKKKEDDSQNPRKKEYSGKKASDGKVVAFTATPGKEDKRHKDKKKDKDKRDKFDEMPTDLTRSIHKKHSKYKDKTEVIEEVNPELENLQPGSYVINVPITLGGFCEQTETSTSQAIMCLMKMGIMANINQNLEEETAVLLGMELGINVVVNKVEEIEAEEGIDLSEDREADLQHRPPVVTVMGHVDHGKTSLLDAIRSTNVTAGEAGGITQHIGASEVEINGQKIVFLDTPGHEAFTAMRARGAHITDIAVLVVAADDGVMPQTIESISHAKAAGVPIIVAINKMDKPAANPERVKTELADQGILVEDWGGTTIAVPVSAKTGMGITNLLEMILLQAEMLELKANPDRLAQGNVIEARLDKNRGPVATLLVTNGTLSAGSALVAGTASGRIRVMSDWTGKQIPKAGPSRAVEITGLTEVPEAGDEFYAVKDDRTAREIAERRKEKLRQEVLARNSSMSLEKLFSQLEEGETKDLNLIIKADVQGSVGALEQSLEKLQNENVKVRIIHTGVGAVNESDVMLAETSNAVIIGFNVRPSSAVQSMADSKNVEIRCYRIIYEIIDDIEAAMKGMLDPEFKEVILGKAEVRSTFKVPNVGIIAGAYIIEGKVARNAQIRLLRDGVVVHEGLISSLKRFKDDAKEVLSGYECGIGIEKYNDVKEGDIIEAFTMEEIKRN